jgi:hypothetical protein
LRELIEIIQSRYDLSSKFFLRLPIACSRTFRLRFREEAAGTALNSQTSAANDVAPGGWPPFKNQNRVEFFRARQKRLDS